MSPRVARQQHGPAQPSRPILWPTASASAPDTQPADLADRREQICMVVRVTMARLGFVTASYSCKLVKLDSSGNRYIILMQLCLDPELLPDVLTADAEYMLRDRCMSKYGIFVSAVFWRRSDRLAGINQSGRTSKELPSQPSTYDSHSGAVSSTQAPALPRPPARERRRALAFRIGSLPTPNHT